MAYELIYTSVPRGLRPGTSGFCTVAHTAGMPSAIVREIEALSAYRPGAIGTAGAGDDAPPMRSHYYLPHVHGGLHVLSRITAAGLDHTRRANKLAHHIILKPDELPMAGPGWLLTRPGLFVEHWSMPPCVLCEPPHLPHDHALDETPRRCVAWHDAAGDAGWAGAVAGKLLKQLIASPRAARSAFHVIVPESLDAMPLMHEVISLLPLGVRWKVTFNTRLTQPQPPAGLMCLLRFVPGDTEAGRALASDAHGSSVLDLSTTVSLPPPPQSEDVECGRTGRTLTTRG